jgi:hypothetical protein
MKALKGLLTIDLAKKIDDLATIFITKDRENEKKRFDR